MPELILMIFVGGGVGAWARFRFGGWVHRRAASGFPWSTLAINLLGSFLLGLLLPLLDVEAPLAPLNGFVAVGCLGGFTTFSTFAYEALGLLEEGRRFRAGVYVAASLGLGLLSIVAGLLLGTALL